MEHRVTYQIGVIGIYLRRKRALLKYIAGENNTFKVADARKPLENGIGLIFHWKLRHHKVHIMEQHSQQVLQTRYLSLHNQLPDKVP